MRAVRRCNHGLGARAGRLLLAASVASVASFAGGGCAGGVSLAPHLNREKDLGPAASAERYGVVLDRASAFEQQNLKSRDVHWYRMWRAAAMIGLGQVDQALALIDQVFADLASAVGTAPAQPDRLRAFGYDQRARAAMLQGRPRDALADLERAYALATEVSLETRGECDQSIMLAARSRQLEDVARSAGDAGRAETAHAAAVRQLDKWSKCLGELDYPGLSVVAVLSAALASSPGALPLPAPVEQVPGPAPARPEPAQPPARLEEPARPKPAERPANLAAMAATNHQYAPVDPTPWRAAIESILPLAQKHGQNVRGDVVIRTDGHHHALRLRASIAKLETAEQLVPLFRSTVVFFEQARAISPKVERVVITIEGWPGGPLSVLATKNDVLELFQDRLDAAAFARRLVRVL